MAIGCAAELGNGSHYKHEGDSAYWVIFGSHDIALLHIKYIPLGDAERVNVEVDAKVVIETFRRGYKGATALEPQAADAGGVSREQWSQECRQISLKRRR